MTTASIITETPSLSNDLSIADRWVGSTAAADRRFRLALLCAILMHAALFIGVGRSAQRVIGDEQGSPETISVSLITEADFLSETSVPVSPPPGEQSPAPPQPQQPPPQPQPPLQPEAKPEPTPPVEVAPWKPTIEPTAEPTPAPTPPPQPETQVEATPQPQKLPEIEKEVPNLLSLEGPAPKSTKSEGAETPAATKPEPAKPDAAKAAPAKPAPPKPKPQKTAKLDLSTPPPSFSAPVGGGGRQAAFSRPPGITRSGLNDAFARGVIRALQQTMPQLRETRGRVTVRILLTENGNVREVQLVTPSPLSQLNQSVVFAAKQTSYPIPPGNSNEADRTFLITYIYN